MRLLLISELKKYHFAIPYVQRTIDIALDADRAFLNVQNIDNTLHDSLKKSAFAHWKNGRKIFRIVKKI